MIGYKISIRKEINNMKVYNMKSSSGKEVPNQFIIEEDNNGRYFQSYSTIIAYVPWNRPIVKLDINKWDYSVTTAKYRNKFLGMTTKEIKEAIKTGIIELVDLNGGNI